MPPIRILVVDSYALFRDGIRALLERADDLCWVGEAGDAETAVQLAMQLEPDVVLMALQLSQGDAFGATQEILADLPQTRVIALTRLQDDNSLATAMRVGVTGYVLKDARASELLQAIRIVGAGGVILDSRIASRAMTQLRQVYSQTDSVLNRHLTERELEVLRLVSAGCSNREIAASLHLSEQTIKNALSGLYQKLEVHKRTEAVIAGRRLGLIRRQP